MVNNTRTKFLTRQQRLNIKRGTTVTEDPFQTKTKRLDARQRESLRQNRIKVDEAAKDNDNKFNNNNFGGSLSNFKKQYNTIDPVIRRRMKVNPTFVEREIKKRINEVEDRIETVRKQIKNRKGSEKREFKAELQGLEERRNELKKGNLLSVQEIRSFARDLRKQTEKQQKLSAFNQKATKVIVPEIVNEARFLEGQADKYTRLKGIERINYMNDIKKQYGNDVFNSINQVANLKQDSKTFNINDLNKIASELEQRNKNKKSSRVTVGDIATFKLTVNTLLDEQRKNATIKGDFKPLPLTEPLSKYNTELKRLQVFNKNVIDNIQKPLVLKQFKPETIENARNKALTGQTMTNAEKSLYLADIGKRKEDLTRQQINATKKILASPFNYGKSLIIRQQAGEQNPLFNDLKNFSKGVGQGLKEIFVDPVVGSFNYGRNLVKRAEKGNTAAIKILNKDIKKLTKTIKNVSTFVINNPIATGMIVGAAVGQGFKATKAAYKKDPAFTLGLAVAYLFPGTVLKGAAKTPAQLSRLSPKFRTLKAGQITLGGNTKLTKIWNSSADFLKGKLGIKFPKFKKNPEIILKKQTVSSGAKSLKAQAALAGQEVTAVNTAANQITGWLKRKVIIRKPIPGEEAFPKAIKQILSKFDNGTKLSKKQFAKVNKWLQKNVAPNITLLERSLYADPASGFRTSRLGIQKAPTATLKDFFTGNFKLVDTQRPQVLIFQNAKVAKFPKKLKKIETKLKTGKKLTVSETNDLIAWQVESGKGKFKPVGSTIYQGGRELEVTLPPGDFVKRIKKVGTTIIEGKKVDFVTAEAFTPPKTLAAKIKKAKAGKLTKAQVEALEKELSKKLGTKTRVETPNLSKFDRRALRQNVPVLRLRANRLRVSAVRRAPRATPTKRTPRKTPAKRTPRATSTKRTPRKTPTKRTPRATPTKRTPRTARKTPAKRTPRVVRTIPVKKTPAKPRIKTIKLPLASYNSLVKEKKRISHNLFYKEAGKDKVLRVLLPKNKAIKRAETLLKTKKLRRVEIVAVGSTGQRDIKKPVLDRKLKLENKKIVSVLKRR